MRINELARKFDLSNREVIDYLTRLGVKGKSHSSALDDDLVERVLKHFKKKPEAEEKPEVKSRFKRIKRVRPRPEELAAAEAAQQLATQQLETQQPETPQPTAAQAAPPEIETPEQTTVLDTGETIRMTPSGPVVVSTDDSVPKKEEPTVEQQLIEPAAAAPTTAPPAAIQPQRAQRPSPPPPQPRPDMPRAADTPSAPPAGDPRAKKGKERPARGTDDALRKEIQKLKKKRIRTGGTETPGTPPTPGAGRPAPGRPRRAPFRGRGRDGGRGKRAWRREKRERLDREIAAEVERERVAKTFIKVHEGTTVADVASALDISPNMLIGKLIGMGVMATLNQPLDHDAIELVAAEYGLQVQKVDLVDDGIFAALAAEDVIEEDLVSRPPIVTIMGHVDHGKTKLLDSIRQSDITATEAGGITQHIGAYQVKHERGTVTFLDTPGHAAFTAMRARGAMVTDLVILVVAADDSVMPQTVEAISHAKAANVPIIVAINKIDKEGANIDRTKQALSTHGILAEDWGGDVQVFPISALQGIGIDELLEGILLQSEMLELKASPKIKARGTIVEARREEGRGTVATVLIQEGTLRVGEPFVSGLFCGRVRAMSDERGSPRELAGPGTPVEITGLQDVPTAGDPFAVVEDDSQARQTAIKLQQAQRQRALRKRQQVTLDQLHDLIEEGGLKELMLVVKGDVQGSVEAVVDNLLQIESDKVKVRVIHHGVGPVNESDIMLASASNALVIGFSVSVPAMTHMLAKQEGVEIRTFTVIYRAIDAIRNAMTGLLDSDYKENILGRCLVREVFRLSKDLSIAGCQVQDGKITRNRKMRVLRDAEVLHKGTISSLKRFKDDVPEVQTGFECGVGVERFDSIRVGDIIECFELEEVAPTL